MDTRTVRTHCSQLDQFSRDLVGAYRSVGPEVVERTPCSHTLSDEISAIHAAIDEHRRTCLICCPRVATGSYFQQSLIPPGHSYHRATLENLVMVAFSNLYLEGDLKGLVQSVTFIATNGADLYVWPMGSADWLQVELALITDWRMAADFLQSLCSGNAIVIPGRWDLSQIEQRFEESIKPN